MPPLNRFGRDRDARGGVYGTPWPLFNQLDAEFGFTLDVCALPENAKCERYFQPGEDGLQQDWCGVCWLNPPYGRGIHRWIEKAYDAARRGATVVCLIPVRTEVAWWHDFVMQATEVRFLRGRIQFEGMKNNATFGCAVVVFRPA